MIKTKTKNVQIQTNETNEMGRSNNICFELLL